MRVLMVSKAVVVGIYQRKLELLAERGVDLLVVAPPYWRDERGSTPLERAYVRGYQLETRPLIRNGDYHLHAYRGLGAVVRAFAPDIVHIDEEPYNLAAWQTLYHARRAGARTVFFTWQNIARTYPPPFAWGERLVLRHTQHAIAGTESAAEVLRRKGFRKPIRVIPQFGTDPDLFHPPPAGALAARATGPFTIGYVGRLVPEKGIDVLLHAAVELARDASPRGLCLRVIGGGPERDALRARAVSLGLTECIDWVPQQPSQAMPPLYHTFDVLVLPSLTRPNWKEQFGRVLVEAMASGVPVVGSDSGAIPGVIDSAGLVVPEGNARALAQALRHLRDDRTQWDAYATRGRVRAVNHFSQESVADATLEVYQALSSQAVCA
jgi:glycosyltransferase involved in cell wall biosynthesis